MKKPALTVLCLLWAVLAVLAWVKPAGQVSDSERRKLAQRPAFTVESLLTGSFMGEFETYAQDQFPFREPLRTMKAVSSLYLLGQKDVHEVYVSHGYAVKQEYPLKESSVLSATKNLQAIYDAYLVNTDCKVYAAIIPEKGYFLADNSGHLGLDYTRLLTLFCQNTEFARYVDIWDGLTVENYYKTDPHWRQETLSGVAEKLAAAMGTTLPENDDKLCAREDFLGLYPSQTGLPMGPEQLLYLNSSVLDGCTVENFETGETGGIYNEGKLHSREPYDFFLSGPCALMTIHNPNAQTDRSLVVFRDSFGSSLVPLLAGGYRSVTLVDIRYIKPSLLENFFTFENQDVLFLYGATLLNNSAVLKTD